MVGKYLITTAAWFYAPDGNQYRAAWGNVEVIEDTFLGVKTNRNSTNWFIKIGSEEKCAIISGCQINYAVRCENRPDTRGSKGWSANAKHGLKEYTSPNVIYIAE